MNKRNAIFTIVGTLALGGAALIAGVSLKATDNAKKVDATTSDHVRVYVYLDNGWTDWSGLTFYVHYWGGTTSSDWASCPSMTKVVSDYYQGLWFYDLPADTTGILIKTAAGNVDNWRETENIDVTSYKPSDYVFYVKEAVSSNNKRWWDKVTTAGMNSGQLAAVLSTIHACDTDTGYGFNSWPQLNPLFVTPSTGRDDSTSLTNWNGQTSTIGATISMIRDNYNKANNIQSAYSVSDQNKVVEDVSAVAAVGALGVMGVAGYFLLKKKKIA